MSAGLSQLSAPAARSTPVPASGAGYDVAGLRAQFPALARLVHGHPLVYLDSAATTHKPLAVLEAERDFYTLHNANVHRGVHTLAEEATELYEGARRRVAAFIGAAADEVVFTKGATEALNLLAYTLGAALRLGPGDEVCVTEMEHHSNLVPWQLLCERTGATLRWLTLTDDGRLDLSSLDQLLTERTRILAVVHQSNLLGTINPVVELAARARAAGAVCVVDACQSVPAMPVDVGELGADFLAFSGHKMCGPTGVGVLWGRRAALAELPPFHGGGEMIETVTMARSTYAPPPHRFEAGTPPIAQAIGLGAAVDFLTGLPGGMAAVAAHEAALTADLLDRLRALPGVRVIGPADTTDRGAAVSFVLDGVHPHDVGQVLDTRGIAVRVGHHCARPGCLRYGVPATTRASFGLYSTPAEVAALVDGLLVVQSYFRR